MSARTLGILAVVLVGGLIAFLTLSGGQNSAHRQGDPLGYAGLIGYLESRGLDTEVSRQPPAREDRADYARILIEPRLQANGSNGRGLNRTTFRRKIDNVPTIIVFPKWLVRGPDIALFNRAELALLADAVDRADTSSFYRPAFPKIEKLLADPAPDPFVLMPQGVLALGVEYKLLAREGRIILAAKWVRKGMPDTLIIYEPDLISNHGLANGSHAALLIPEIEALVADRTLMIDQSTWEPRTEEFRSSGGPSRPWEPHRLFTFPFAYVWMAFGLLVLLTLWGFLGRTERISAGPEGLQPPPSLDRRLSRLARLWARHVPDQEIFARYEAALVREACHRLALRGEEGERRRALEDLEEARLGTTILREVWADPSQRPEKRLQTIRRVLHDL